MISGLHLLLTYRCTGACDHCFLYCSPESKGVFTLDLLDETLAQARLVPTLRWIYFEGGEPFLYHPLLLECLRRTRHHGYHVGVVTNAYWATGDREAELWLRPLRDLGVEDLSVSEDLFHGSVGPDSPPARAGGGPPAPAAVGCHLHRSPGGGGIGCEPRQG